jgi:hypothetical protein
MSTEKQIIESIKKNLTIDDDGTTYVNKDKFKKGFLHLKKPSKIWIVI